MKAPALPVRPDGSSWCPWCGDDVGPGVLFCCTDCSVEYRRDVRRRGVAVSIAQRAVAIIRLERAARRKASEADAIAQAQARVAAREGAS